MMPRLFFVLMVALGMALPLAAPAAAQDAAFLTVAETPGFGAFLADAEGMTLYLFTPDTEPNASTCDGGCAEAWPPLAPADEMPLPAGVPGELTVVDRADGAQQVAYNGIPLYLYAANSAPGDTTGHDVGEVWYIVPPGMAFGDEPHHGSEGEVGEATPPASG